MSTTFKKYFKGFGNKGVMNYLVFRLNKKSLNGNSDRLPRLIFNFNTE